MKKHILPGLLLGAAVAFMTAPSVQAQIRNDRGTFNMPKTGDWLFETQANLDLTGGRIFNLNDQFLANLHSGLDIGIPALDGHSYFPMLKARYFAQPDVAYRLMFNISFDNDKRGSGGGDSSIRNFGIALGWGMEKIYTPAERLNTYLGFDATLGYTQIKAEAGSDWLSQGAFGLGLRAFTGMDYYVLPKVYLGMELGYGLSFANYGKVKFDGGDNDVTQSDFTLTPYVTPVFRLGYVLGAKKMKGNGQPSYRSDFDDYMD